LEKKSRKIIIAGGILMLAAAFAIFACLKLQSGEEMVRFESVKEKQVPQDLSSNIIPEYRTLERALACIVDDDVYVIVTRGEKPSSGFGVTVDRMMVEEKDGKKNLIVYALFEDPDKKTAISQILTYPTAIVKTELKTLPDTIELRIQY
jgi:hypothetical protein